MDAARYDYEKLRKQYDGFQTPSCRILINGRSFENTTDILQVEAELLTSRWETGSVRIRLDCRQKMYMDQFPLMSKLAIELGYGQKRKKVFDGHVFERLVEMEQTAEKTLTVIGLDYKAPLRMHNSYISHPDMRSAKDVVKAVAGPYGYPLHAGETPAFPNPIQLNQNGASDFDYIAGIAEDMGYEFFALTDGIYFRKPGSIKGEIITLGPDSIYSLLHRSSAAGLYAETAVSAYNQDKKQEIKVSSKRVEKVGSGSTGTELLKKRKVPPVHHMIAVPTRQTAQNLEKHAAARLQENSMKLTRLWMESDGLPELIPGRFLKLNGVTAALDNTYYVTGIKHVFDTWEYRTELVCSSNTVRE